MEPMEGLAEATTYIAIH